MPRYFVGIWLDAFLLSVLLAAFAADLPCDDNLLSSVAEWSTTVGATNPPNNEVISTGNVSDGGTTITLSGNGGTTSKWKYFFKEFDTVPGSNFLLSAVVTIADGTAPISSQFNNAWIGLRMLTGPLLADGTTLLMKVEAPLQQGVPTAELVALGSPEGTRTAHAGVFLSMSGSLTASNLCLRETDSFSSLVEHMDRYYSHFGSAFAEVNSTVAWENMTNSYRDAATAAPTAANFAEIVAEMLAGLGDMHVSVTSGGTTLYPFLPQPTSETYNWPAVLAKLEDPTVDDSFVLGRTLDSCYGYFLTTSLLNAETVPDDKFDRALSQFKALVDDDSTSGLILDLRANAGGSELRARRIASLLSSGDATYGRQMFRSGRGHGDFVETPPRVLGARDDGRPAFAGPAVAITGGGCVSSCEALAMMLRALPGVAVVGAATGGASGNPRPVALGNGVEVSYSRWVSLLPDGTPIERAGVAPDEVFVPESDGDDDSDSTFDFAYSVLEGLAPCRSAGDVPGPGEDKGDGAIEQRLHRLAIPVAAGVIAFLF